MTAARRTIEWKLPIAGLVISLAGAILGWLSADGAALGVAIAGVAFAAVIVPPLVGASRDALNAMAVAAASFLATFAVWLFAIPDARVALVLLCFTFAIAGLTLLLTSLRLHMSLAAAIVTVLALAWLSWPIWLSHHLGSQFPTPLITAHPIFAINGTSPTMGAWTHQPLMYRLTALGQDVPYALPESGWPCTLAHAGMAVSSIIASHLLLHRRARRRGREGAGPSDR